MIEDSHCYGKKDLSITEELAYLNTLCICFEEIRIENNCSVQMSLCHLPYSLRAIKSSPKLANYCSIL